MPILNRELDLFPESLFDGDGEGMGASRWWALYTLPRREKELVRRLVAGRITCYCPCVPHRSKSPAGRQRVSYLPLFGSYVFMAGDELQRYVATQTNCVSRCLDVADGGRLYRDLHHVWQVIQSGVPLTPEARLASGQRVTVRSGKLAGLEGTIVRRHGSTRLIVAVNFLQRGASVLLEDCDVAAL
jgi:transcriptional antiterminator RfaH